MTDPFNPLTFVGRPDWRSALLAVLFTLPWLLFLGRGYLRRWQACAAIVAGAVLFPISIAWVQAPIEQGLNLLWLRLLDAAAIERWLLALGVPSMAVTGLVQEGVKLLVAVVALRLLWATRRPSAGPAMDQQPSSSQGRPLAGLALGAAAGAGYGGFEAFWVFNMAFASGLTWASVQLLGVGALRVFLERLFAVPFHIASTTLTGYGFAAGRPWRYLLLAIALHSAMNYTTVLLQAGLIDSLALNNVNSLLAAATLAAALWLHRATVQRAAEAS